MTEFLSLLPPQQALSVLLSNLEPQRAEIESIAVEAALHRITARPVVAPHGLPEFPRATVDGYALMARDTFGASGSQPSYATLIGEVPMGKATSIRVELGQCAAIHTGGMLPAGADAVIMLENTQIIGRGAPAGSPPREIEILKSLAAGENVISAGEDVRAGEVVLDQGREIRAAEVGGLAALGVLTVDVLKKPLVAILSTGDEVVAPNVRPLPGQVRDVNA
ncbi:MAG TPA: molybdopterin molybdenumtransferase MoeA, partial [Anaerolineales bacterium]|nr:molybdopterin molybdenumtransferase MoeA [Anaerolineales bacterium]